MLRPFCVAVCWIACANLAAVAALGSYDLDWNGHHLAAHQTFKPILFLSGALWLALLTGRGRPGLTKPEATPSDSAIRAGLVAGAIALYWRSAQINVHDSDWNHRLLSASVHSWTGLARFFTDPKPDGFYRPLGFLSLWADYAIFGDRLWACHVQSIALHASNALLVFQLARTLRLSRLQAAGAAFLFACAAVNFEAVLWPAARFDLLATAFALLSLNWFLRYAESPDAGTKYLVLSTGAYLLGLLSKESAYCAPAVMVGLAVGLSLKMTGAKKAQAALFFGAATTAALCARLAVYHGPGGYPPPPTGEPAHFRFTLRTVQTLATHPLGIPLLGVNATAPFSPGTRVAIVVFCLSVAVLAANRLALGRRERIIALMAIVSALPAANLVGWVDHSMQNARYLYLPGVWISLLVAAAAARARAGPAVLAGLCLANAAGVLHNLAAYRSLLGRAASMADQIRATSVAAGVTAVDLIDLPGTPHGVFFFSSEVISPLRKTLDVRQMNGWRQWCAPGQKPSDAVYVWNKTTDWLDGPTQCREGALSIPSARDSRPR